MENPILLLISLRWDVDQLVYLAEYDALYWLKPCISNEGKRIGITACCEKGYECEHHKNIKVKVSAQYAPLN